MIHILWALFGLAMFIFFIIACIRAAKLLKEEFGLATVGVFMLGLLSYVIASGPDAGGANNTDNRIPKWTFAGEDTLKDKRMGYLTTGLDSNLLNTFELGIQFAKDPLEQTCIPVSGRSWANGLSAGTQWIPASIKVQVADEQHKFAYRVDGVVEWKLFNTTVYRQPKQYFGFVWAK